MTDRQKMARRLALRTLSGSSGTALSALIQSGASQSRVALDQLKAMVDRALALVNESDQKDHIYAEAGDMISNVRGVLDRLEEGLAIVSYASAKVDEKKLKNGIPATIRDEIDKAVKKDT